MRSMMKPGIIKRDYLNFSMDDYFAGVIFRHFFIVIISVCAKI